MSLAASIQITDQDINQQATVKGAANIGQLATTPDGRTFAYARSGGALTAGQITEPATVTANYVTRTLTTAAAQGSSQVTVPLGATAAADAFIGFWLVITSTSAAGAGQGSYMITGNTAATAGNSNTTILRLGDGLATALTTSSVVGIYPNQESNVIAHTAVYAIPTAGAPVIGVTSGNYFWNQTGGYASILVAAAAPPTKNALAIPDATTPAAVTIGLAATVTAAVGYAPELAVVNTYSPLVLTIAG